MDLNNCTTIVKFFRNPAQGKVAVNPVITRTMKKIGVIVRKEEGEIPQDGEFWKVKIQEEICQGQPEGCFILEPIAKIDPKDIMKLLPGMYVEQREDNIIAILPKDRNRNWILPLKHKRKIQAYTVVVVLSDNNLATQ
jgi:hypothetical protein